MWSLSIIQVSAKQIASKFTTSHVCIYPSDPFVPEVFQVGRNLQHDSYRTEALWGTQNNT